ncbi:MAG TPA: metallophosphoesterase N-terminal domain-containing protein, partial [Prolixibacteraceae bacterium]|nr:metallophosphoesterase N-terminal domain-containing protein [Prolixibacteraceae bacterium]
MKRLALLFLGALMVTGSLAQNFVTGFVYEDLNRNGKKERREKAIPGVAVSNGTEVVLTGSKGEYSLPVGDDNIIFVIKPRDYT